MSRAKIREREREIEAAITDHFRRKGIHPEDNAGEKLIFTRQGVSITDLAEHLAQELG